MESAVIQRIKQIIEFYNLSVRKFGEKVGVAQSTLSSLFSRNSTPSSTLLQSILNAFEDVNSTWLLTGEGNMLKSSVKIESNASLITEFEVQYVPLVNQYAYAGYLDGYNDCTYLEQLPKMPFIVDREGRGNYMAFEIKGDSMDDGTDEGYKEGETLLCREIGPHLWATSRLHLKKWDFVIVHEEGILLKRIIDHNVDNHTITIHSLNEFYSDKIIDLREVKQIFNVVQSLKSRRR